MMAFATSRGGASGCQPQNVLNRKSQPHQDPPSPKNARPEVGRQQHGWPTSLGRVVDTVTGMPVGVVVYTSEARFMACNLIPGSGEIE